MVTGNRWYGNRAQGSWGHGRHAPCCIAQWSAGQFGGGSTSGVNTAAAGD